MLLVVSTTVATISHGITSRLRMGMLGSFFMIGIVVLR